MAVELRWCCRACDPWRTGGASRGRRGAERYPRRTGHSIYRLQLSTVFPWLAELLLLRRRFLEHGQERRIHHARPAVAHSGG